MSFSLSTATRCLIDHVPYRYYIDLGATQPRATFVHPIDELIDEGEELLIANNTTSLSAQNCSSGSSSRPPSRTRVKSPTTPIGSPVCRRATTAQQLYASSLGSGSKISRSVLSSRESVSSSNTGSNSDPEHSHPERSPPQNHPARGDSSSRASPISPAFPVYPNSHDPRNYFDITRLSQGARKYRHDEASRSNGSSQTVLAHPPSTSQSPSPTHPTASGEPSTRADGSTNNLPSTMNALSLTNDLSPTPATSGPIPSEAQAFYNPSVVAKPLSPSRATIVADRQNYPISVPLSGGVSRNTNTERGQKRPQPIQITQRPSDNYKLYTAVTEDETLKVVPKSGSTAYPDASGVTEDNLLVLPSHPTPQRDSHLSPTINVLDVQNPDSPPPVLHDMRTKPIRTLSISRLHIKKKKKSPSVDNTLVLQQPRPVRPLGGLSAQLNDQVSGLDPSEDAKYYAENFKGKGKERKGYGFSSIFETMDRLANRESGIIIREYA